MAWIDWLGYGGSPPRRPILLRLADATQVVQGKPWLWLLLGILAFVVTASWRGLPAAVDPVGVSVALTREGQLALALFLLAAIETRGAQAKR